MGTPECVFGMRDLGTRDLGCGEACMVGRGDVGCGDAGMWGLEDMGSRGHQFGDGALSRTGMRDQGRGEVRNKRNHFLLQINVKYNFQRIKGRSLSEVSQDDRTRLGNQMNSKLATQNPNPASHGSLNTFAIVNPGLTWLPGGICLPCLPLSSYIPSTRSLVRLLFRPVYKRGEGDKAGKCPLATATRHYFKPGFTVAKVSKLP